jgi:acetoin utilization protein AcuB
MLAAEIISTDIPPLRTSDSGLKAIAWMEEFKLAHLPIVNHADFLGMISEDDIYALNQPEEALGNHPLSLHKPFVRATDHVLEVLRIVNVLSLSSIAVLDDQDRYLGLITQEELVRYLSSITSIRDPGGILALEIAERDYSLAQIAQIVESNDAKILFVYVQSVLETSMVEVTLKVNRQDLRSVIATFHRYNYVVKGLYHGKGDDDLDARFENLMNFINV